MQYGSAIQVVGLKEVKARLDKAKRDMGSTELATGISRADLRTTAFSGGKLHDF